MIPNNTKYKFVAYDALTSTSNSITYLAPSQSINIKSNQRNINSMPDYDDNDGSDLLSIIDRSLQDFNESIQSKPSLVSNDSAYNTAASSLSNTDIMDSMLPDELAAKLLLSSRLVRQNVSRKDPMQMQQRHPSGGDNINANPSWSSTSYHHPSPLEQGHFVANNRRRLQSCSILNSDFQTIPQSQFENFDPIFPNPLSPDLKTRVVKRNSTSYNSQNQDILCHPKYCPDSPMRMRQMRCSSGYSPSIPQKSTTVVNSSFEGMNDSYSMTSNPMNQLSSSVGEDYSRLMSPSGPMLSVNQGHQIAKCNRACSFYLRGHCKKEDCEFAHDLTKVTCRFWKTNSCIKGSQCPFLHGYPPGLESGLSCSLPTSSSNAMNFMDSNFGYFNKGSHTGAMFKNIAGLTS